MLRPRFPFNPRSLPNLQLWLAADHASLVRAAGQAAQFTRANSESLTVASNASLQTGDISFTIWFWVKFDTLTAGNNYGMIAKGAGGALEYSFTNFVNLGRFQFNITGNFAANAAFTPTVGEWAFVVGWYDNTGSRTENIQVNNGTATTGPDLGGIPTVNANEFRIGRGHIDADFMDGAIEAGGFIKRVLTAAERTILYNGGTPLTYDQLPPTIRNDDLFISNWPLTEPSGTREDLHGTNDLTDNNTVTTAAGTALNAVTTWTDLSGQQGNLITQATQANKPVVRGAVGRTTLDNVSTSIPFKRNLRFDGVNDILSGGDILRVTSQLTMFVVYSADNVTSLQFIVGKGLGGNYYSSYLGFIQTSNFKFTMATNSTPNAENIVASGTTLVNSTAFIGTCRYNGALQEVWTNGAGYASSANTNGFFYSTDNFTIGGSGAGTPASFMTGRIAEVIIYDRALNNAERNRVERYLSSKYNIALG